MKTKFKKGNVLFRPVKDGISLTFDRYTISKVGYKYFYCDGQPERYDKTTLMYVPKYDFEYPFQLLTLKKKEDAIADHKKTILKDGIMIFFRYRKESNLLTMKQLQRINKIINENNN